MDDYKYSISLDTKLIGEKEIAKLQKHLSTTNAKIKESSKKFSAAAHKIEESNKVTSNSLKTVKQVTKMAGDEFERYSKRLAYAAKKSKSKMFKQQIADTRQYAAELRAATRQLERYDEKLKKVEESSKAKSKTMKKGAEAEIKRQEKLWQAHKKAGIEYKKQTSMEAIRQEKLWQAHQKAGDEYAKQAKVEMQKQDIWKKGAGTQQYVNKLLKTSGDEYGRLTSRITETGDAQNIANDISKRGYKTLTPELKKELAQRVKSIEAIRKSGVTIDANTKKQHEAIMQLNGSLKKHHTAWGKAGAGIAKGFGMIKKAGMAFLTILGPLFLVGAALRTLKSATDWIYQPFIKFEDALYELRKTANLTNEAMLDIGDAISELSLVVPVAAEELAKIAATAGRLGIRGRENILAFTETIAKMSVATVLTADEAAEALARIRQAFAIPVESIEYLGSVINELSNTTASNSRDIVAALGNIGAAGKMLNITADEAAAMGATLISSGMHAERAGPFSKDTEILTSLGWKLIKDLKIGDLLYTLNPHTDEIEIYPNENLIVNEWTGKDMIHIKSKSIDLKVTPEHKLWIQPNHQNEYKAIPAKNVLPRRIVRFKRSAKWKGENPSHITIPGLNYNYNNNAIEKNIPTELFVKYIGMFLAEGTIHNNRKQIQIAQNVDSSAYKEFEELHEELKKCGFNYGIQKDKRGHGKGRKFVISNKQLTTFMINLGFKEKSYNKYVPTFIKNFNPELLKDLIYYYFLGDGTKDSRFPNITSFKLSSSSEKLIDDFQEICLKAGYVGIKGRDRKQWGFVSITNSKKLSFARPSYILNVQTAETQLNPQINTNSQSQTHIEKYKGKVYCPVVKNHIVYVRRNGRPVWCQQTRIRRALTEVARKSEEITKFMEKDGKKWAETLEREPMQALLMYLEKLTEVESSTEKIRTAHEHFGKVGGFAIATLAENYEELIKNLETANDEMAFGTSLQREFAIATDKTSAQLQILANRSDAAKRAMGEDLQPGLIKAKGALVVVTEALADFVDGLTWETKKLDKGVNMMDIFNDELERLANEVDAAPGKWETMGIAISLTSDHLRSSSQRITEYRKNMQELVEEMNDGTMTFTKLNELMLKEMPGAFGTLIKVVTQLRDVNKELNESTLDLNAYLGIQAQRVYLAKRAWQDLYGYLEGMHDENYEGLQDTKLWIEYQNKIPSLLAEVDKSIKDDTENRKAKNEIMAIEEALERKAKQAILDSLAPLAEEGALVGENAENYEIHATYLEDLNDKRGENIGLVGDSSAAYQLNNTLIDWQNNGIKKSSLMFVQLHKIFGKNTKDMIERGTMIDGLNEKDMMVIQNGKEIIIVSKEMNNYFGETVDIGSEAERVLDKYGMSIKKATDETKLLDIATRELIDTSNSLWGGLDSLTSAYTSGLEAQYKYREMEKRMPSTIKNILSPMQSRIDLAKSLVEAGEDDVAVMHLATVAEDLYTQGLMETNKQRQIAYTDAFEYIETLIKAIGGAPSEVEKAKMGFGELFEPTALQITADTTLFQEMFKTEIEEKYLNKIYTISLVTEIVEGEDIEGTYNIKTGEKTLDELQHGIPYVPKTGLYKLHEGETVLTKSRKEVTEVKSGNTYHFNFGGISLSPDYPAQKMMKDIEDYATSHII